MSTNFQRIWKSLPSFFRHPFTLLVAGALITSFLLPSILSNAAKKESDRKEKLNLAFKFINRNSEMNQNFNSLITSLELFHKYSTPRYLKQEQEQLRKESKTLYMNLNQDLWSWHWNLYEQAKIWNLLPTSDQPYVKQSLMNYSESWMKVFEVLPRFWDECLKETYKVRDPRVTKLMIQTRTQFDASVSARDSTIRFIISKFDIEQLRTMR